MSKNLQIIPYKLTKGQTFEKITGVLTLQNAGDFKVTIPEYLEELKNIEKQIDQKYAEKNKAYSKVTRLYNDKAKDGWTEDERKSNKANNEVYRGDSKKIDNEIIKLRAQKTNLNQNEKYKDIGWAWQLVGNGIRSIPGHNSSFKSGLLGFTSDVNGVKEYNEITFSKLIEGGGLAWLEVFSPTDPATGKLPNGFYVRALGKPKVLRTEWTDFDFNPIKTKVRFGSEVLLHIYTEAMYGQEVKIELIDRDIFDPNDVLDISNTKTFIREALVYKINPNEDKKLGIDGALIINSETSEDQIKQQYLQKIVVEVLITPSWIKDAGNSLKIFPTVKSLEKEIYFTDFTRSYLDVGKDGILYTTPKEITNLPVVVGEVETNAATFHPCRYDLITLKKQLGGSVEIFNSKNDLDVRKRVLEIDIIAGKKATYLLDFDFKTEECPRDHKSKEITVTSVPTNYELLVDLSSKAEHSKAEKKFEWMKTDFSISTNTSFGAKSTQKENVSAKKGLVTVKQEQLEFDAFYNYDIPNNFSLYTFAKAMKYFNLRNLPSDKIFKINANVKSCAFKQNIKIIIYPDIKWTLKFGFNVDKEDIEKLNRKGGSFAPLKTYQDEADKNDEAQFKYNKKNSKEVNKENFERKKILDKTAKKYSKEYNLKPKSKIKPIDKGSSFKKFLEILSKITLSLEEEHYGGDVKNELTEDFVRDLYEKMQPVLQLASKATGILEGEFDKKDFSSEQEKSIDGLMAKLKRKTVAYEFLYPKLSFAASWFYEQIDADKYPTLAGRQGLGLDLMLKAAPLVGVTINWDILELLCRRHPIAYAILKTVDTLLYVLGDDESAIKCDFSVTGKIDATVDFQYNFAAGFKEVNAKGKTSMQAELKLSLKLKKTNEVLGWQVISELGIGIGGSIGLGIENKYGVDRSGFYVQKNIIFEGIVIEGNATARLQVKKNSRLKDKNSGFNGGGNLDFEITMLSHTFTTDKIYLI